MTDIMYKLFGFKKGGFYEGLYGLEIETESLDPYKIPSMNYWRNTADGSLRNFGVEYVLKEPLNPDVLEKALTEFSTKTSSINFQKSVYTSVHVHVNILNWTPIHFANFISLYILLENTLSRYCGPSRDGNLFCLKSSVAETTIERVVELFQKMSEGRFYNFYSKIPENKTKYSGINLYTLRKFGSLEIRTHAGTTNTEDILEWVNIIDSIVSSSAKFSTPVDILNFAYSNSVLDMMSVIFPKDLYNKLMTGYTEKEIKTQLWSLLKVVKSVDDWSTFCTKAPQVKKKVSPRSREFDDVEAVPTGPIPTPREMYYRFANLVNNPVTSPIQRNPNVGDGNRTNGEEF